MGYIIPAGFARVTVKYGAVSALGSEVVTGFGVNTTPTEALLDIVEEWADDYLRLYTSNAYVIRSIEARSDVEVVERTLNFTGTLASEPSPPNVAALVKLTTGLTGRANRGRLYLPGVLMDADVDANGQIATGARNNIQSIFTGLGTLLGAASINLVILHSTVGTPTLVTGGSAESVAATQRRRLRA